MLKEQLESTNFDALARRHHDLVVLSKTKGEPHPESVERLINIPIDKLNMRFAG
jgi:hypothetical protein